MDATDPVRAVGAVVRDAAGRILLVKRGHAPQKGRWTLPGGSVEAGETLQAAVAREVREETAITVEVGEELGRLSSPTADGRMFEIHDFAATWVSGTVVAGDDAADARWVAVDDLGALELTDGLIGYLQQFGVVPPDSSPGPRGAS